MKKEYSKPDVLFESFSLCTSIAAGCEIKISTQSQGDCGLPVDGVTVFTGTANGCKLENGGVPIEDDENNGFCYHNPITTNNLFNS